MRQQGLFLRLQGFPHLFRFQEAHHRLHRGRGVLRFLQFRPQLLDRGEQFFPEGFGFRRVLPRREGPLPAPVRDPVGPGIVLQNQALFRRQRAVSAPGHRDDPVRIISVAEDAQGAQQHPADRMVRRLVLSLPDEGNPVDLQARPQGAFVRRAGGQRHGHPAPGNAFRPPGAQGRGDHLRLIPGIAPGVKGHRAAGFTLPGSRIQGKQVFVQPLQGLRAVRPLPMGHDLLRVDAGLRQGGLQPAHALPLLDKDPSVRRLLPVHGQEDLHAVQPPAQPGDQLPQVGPHRVKAVDQQVRPVPHAAVFQAVYHVGPRRLFLVKLSRDQFLVSVPDGLQVRELRPLRAGGSACGVISQFLRRDLALPQFLQCAAHAFHRAGQVRHVPVILQAVRLFRHHPVDRHRAAHLVQGSPGPGAGLLPHLLFQFPGADHPDFQQARQLQARDQVPFRLQGHLFRHIQDQPASGLPALLRRPEHQRPDPAAPVPDDLYPAHIFPPFSAAFIISCRRRMHKFLPAPFRCDTVSL